MGHLKKKGIAKMSQVQLVKIKDGLNWNKRVSGTFPLVKGFKPHPSSKKQGYIHVLLADKSGVSKPTRLHVNASDVSSMEKKLTKEDIDRLEKLIVAQFTTLELLAEAAVGGKLQALAVSGAPGIGKSYTILKALEPHLNSDKVSIMRGFSSGLGLYEQLYIRRFNGNILFLDDCDSIFGDEASLNLLKGALDTTGDRRVGWYTDSNYLRQLDIPNWFAFKGTVIMLTNLDFDAIIKSGNRIAGTVSALISRTTYLNLRVHSNDEIMVRIKQLIKSGSIIKTHNTQEILTWLEKNQNHLRSLSLRTILQLEKLMTISPDNWKVMAESLLFLH
jgi:hypothetical protein